MRSELKGCLGLCAIILFLNLISMREIRELFPSMASYRTSYDGTYASSPRATDIAPTRGSRRSRPVGDVLLHDENNDSWGLPSPRLLNIPRSLLMDQPMTESLHRHLSTMPSPGTLFPSYPALGRFNNTCMEVDNVLTHPNSHDVDRLNRQDPDDWLLLSTKGVKEYPRRATYHNATALFLRTPHHRNIAHGFHDSLFVALHYLHHYHTVGKELILAHTAAWLMDIPERGFPRKWEDAVLVAAMIDRNISRHALLPLLKGKVHCFRELVWVGSSRNGCVSFRECRAKSREETFRWISSLRRYAFPTGEVPPRRDDEISVALYSRGDAPGRRLANASSIARCLLSQLKTNRRYRNVKILVVEKMPKTFYGQVQLWATTDIMITMVGASSTNALWMNERSAIIEISGCNNGFLSWLGRVKRPKQMKIKFRLCNKKKYNVSGIHKRGKLGEWYVVPCEALKAIRVHQYNPVEAIEFYIKDLTNNKL